MVAIEDETVLLDSNRGIFYRLNRTTTPLWAALTTTSAADTAIDAAAEAVTRHGADPARVREDLGACSTNSFAAGS